MVARLNYFTTVQDHCLTLTPYPHVHTAVCAFANLYHKNSRLRIWKLSAPMSQSIEVVGCRVADRPNGELWDVFDQLSFDAYIQLQVIPCNALNSLHVVALQHSSQVLYFTRNFQM